MLCGFIPYEFMCQMCNKVVDLIPVVHHTARPVEAKEELVHTSADDNHGYEAGSNEPIISQHYVNIKTLFCVISGKSETQVSVPQSEMHKRFQNFLRT